MEIKLIILDFDGTIADTRRTITGTFRKTLETLGLPVASEEDCAATIGLPLKEAFLKLLPYISEGEAELCVRTYRKLFEKNRKSLVPKLFPNVIATLKELYSKGLYLSIASSRSRKSLIEFIQEMDLDEYISFVLGADDVDKAKPDPMPVLLTLKHFGTNPENALVVGDMSYDIFMGKNAGTHTCAVTYGNSSIEELKSYGADYIIDDFSALSELV